MDESVHFFTSDTKAGGWFLPGVGSVVTSYYSFNSTEVWSLFNEFIHQVFCSIQMKPKVWLVFGRVTCCLMDVIQAVAASCGVDRFNLHISRFKQLLESPELKTSRIRSAVFWLFKKSEG